MNIHDTQKDLIALVADLDIENTLQGILNRHESLKIQPLMQNKNYTIRRHPQRDSGCRGEADKYLRSFCRTYHYALILFDYHGCGEENRKTAIEIENDVCSRLASVGWNDRCEVIVLDPELEIWVWSDSHHVDRELGWKNSDISLRDWLVENQFMSTQDEKPQNPKEVMHHVLKYTKRAISPSIFKELAENVSMNRCTDRAFQKLKQTLQKWFSK